MSRRIILAVIILIIAVILVLGGYYFYIAYLPKPAFNNSNTNNTNEQPLTGNNINLPSNQNTNAAANQPQDDQAKLKLLATVFAQNYGSYSNQANLTNFDEIYDFMGSTMQKWVQGTYKAEIIKNHPTTVYYAIQTKVLNIQINKLDAAKGTAEILANTQRQEFNGAPSNPEVFSQNLLLNLVKVNDNWIVGSAYWK